MWRPVLFTECGSAGWGLLPSFLHKQLMMLTSFSVPLSIKYTKKWDICRANSTESYLNFTFFNNRFPFPIFRDLSLQGFLTLSLKHSLCFHRNTFLKSHFTVFRFAVTDCQERGACEHRPIAQRGTAEWDRTASGAACPLRHLARFGQPVCF